MWLASLTAEHTLPASSVPLCTCMHASSTSTLRTFIQPRMKAFYKSRIQSLAVRVAIAIDYCFSTHTTCPPDITDNMLSTLQQPLAKLIFAHGVSLVFKTHTPLLSLPPCHLTNTPFNPCFAKHAARYANKHPNVYGIGLVALCICRPGVLYETWK